MPDDTNMVIIPEIPDDAEPDDDAIESPPVPLGGRSDPIPDEAL